MGVPVASDLVARRSNGSDQSWESLGNPAQHEKGTGNAHVAESAKEHLGIGDDTGRVCRPFLALYDVRKGFNLEVILHVDAECIQDPSVGTLLDADIIHRSPAATARAAEDQSAQLRGNVERRGSTRKVHATELRHDRA